LALSYQRIGNWLCNSGKVGPGLASLEKGRDILIKLALANPRVTEYVSHLAGCHMDIGLAYLNHKSQAAGAARALASFHQALHLRVQIDQRQARVLPARAALANTYHTIGRAESAQGQNRAALSAFQKAGIILTEVVQANRDNLNYRSDLARTLHRIGQALEKVGRRAEAVQAYRQALEQRRVVVERAPPPIHRVRELGWAYVYLGEAEERRGSPRQALRIWGEGEHILERFAEAEPRNNWLPCDVSDTLMRRARVYHTLKELDKARNCCQQARIIRARQVALYPRE